VTDLPDILIIDDLRDNIALLGASLAGTARVRFALDGAEGLALARRARPDLILLDLMMPGLDGYAVCEALQRDPTLRDIPVIVITARTDPDSEARALRAGARDFLRKPISPPVVRARVGTHLALARREAQLAALNAELEQRIVERTSELEVAAQRAFDASRAKGEFLANMSHELRTPLSAVISLARLGIRDGGESGTAAERYRRILEAAEHLLGVVDDVLDLAKMEARKLAIETRPFDLAKVLTASAALVEHAAVSRSLRLGIEIDPRLPRWLIGDARRLQQILVNLLGNAVKFTERGSVSLQARCHDEGIAIAVTDTGIGLSEDEIARIFSPFTQADGATSRRYGGTGLGLVISQNLAHLLDGRIEVHSRTGHGSTFTLVMPLRVAPGPEAVAAEDASEGAPTPRLSGLRLLVADDSELNRFLIEQILAHEGAHVRFASDGYEAVQAVQDAGADLDAVLMDIQMPVLDGYAAATRIRAFAPTLPIVALTAHSLPQERERCLAAGMDEHLTKPIDADALAAVLQRLCSSPATGACPRSSDAPRGLTPDPTSG
jgi:signal transduction histidine kinase